MSRYKGFSILARPYALHDSGCWTADLEIRRSGRSQPFALEGRYQSEDEAQVAVAVVGRQIIDGGVAGRSVDHLRVPPLARRTPMGGWRERSLRVVMLAGIVIIALALYLSLRFVRT
jgi:hypothetical protein